MDSQRKPIRGEPAPADVLANYFATYLDPAPVQDAAESGTDSQLSTVTLFVAEWIVRNGSQGATILDVGCGKGTLLQRLVDDTDFAKSTSSLLYVPIDTDENIADVLLLARKARISRRVEAIDIEAFYAKWPQLNGTQLVFCRNVLHELNIAQTAQLLRHIVENIGEGTVVFQDLMTFPKGERPNATWVPNDLAATMTEHGFDVKSVMPYSSKSGARWFNLIATGSGAPGPRLSQDHSIESVVAARHRQWSMWSELERLTGGREPSEQWSKIVAAMDVDLQMAALTRQLRDVGAFVSLDADVERRVRVREIVKLMAAFVAEDRLEKSAVAVRVRLRERGEQLNVLEEFLRSNVPLGAIFGGIGTGKTMLAEHLLATRSYDKSPVVIRATASMDAWSLIESLFSQVGLRLAPQLLSVLDNLAWSSVEVPLRQFVNRFSSRIILLLDNLDSLLDSNGAVQNQDLAKALQVLISARGAKVLVTQRRLQLPDVLMRAAGDLNPPTIRLGRYATEQTVINILDDRFDRSTSGLDEYPERLLRAIDRHPLGAMLCAEILSKEGTGVLADERFILEVQHHMHRELWGRLVDEHSVHAMEVASELRVPVPQAMLEKLSTQSAVQAGLGNSALYTVKDRRWEHLIAALAVFRRRQVEDQAGDVGDVDRHGRIADQYLSTYDRDDDPKWLRESYFHRMLAGGPLAGSYSSYYVGELVGSAEYCFSRKRNYKEALELYDIAAQHTELSEEALMHRASCRLRTGAQAAGEAEFESLAEKYPSNIGIRTSFVDALLFLHQFDEARRRLEQFGLVPDQSDWISGQWGRVWLGLNQYQRAETCFRKQLATSALATVPIFTNLSRALHYQGAAGEALGILQRGMKLHPNDISLGMALGACLERLRRDDEALDVLRPIFDLHPDRTPAALSMVKILGRRGDTAGARRVFERAKKNAMDASDSVLITAEAELLKAENRPEAALQLLRDRPAGDQHVVGMLLECWFHYAKAMPETSDRIRVAKEALSEPIAGNLSENMPIIVNRGRLAALAGDRALFDSLVARLRASRAEAFEVDNLERQWQQHNRAP